MTIPYGKVKRSAKIYNLYNCPVAASIYYVIKLSYYAYSLNYFNLVAEGTLKALNESLIPSLTFATNIGSSFLSTSS